MGTRAEDGQLARARLAYVTARRGPEAPAGHAMPERAVGPADDPAPVDGAPGATGIGDRLRRLLGYRPPGRYVAAVVAFLIVSVGVGVMLLGRSQALEIPVAPVEPVEVPASATSAASSAPPVPIRIHVLGAVASPGVVTLPEGAIVADALAAAGGLAGTADAAELNLAARLSDGQQILIGSTASPRGEIRDQPPPPDDPTGGGPAPAAVNLNTAAQPQLEQLPGVGPVLAAAIVAWRQEHGGFRRVADLREVPGVGPRTFERLEPLVTV